MYLISQLNIYPVKSLGGFSPDRWEANPEGFYLDRTWLLTTDYKSFVSQRDFPDLARFNTDIKENTVTVTFDGQTISFGYDEIVPERHTLRVWDDDCTVFETPPHLSEWFSDMLHVRIFLVRQADNESRLHYSSVLQKPFAVTMADGYPYLILGTASLQDLNARLETPVPVNRFRPNIVVTTGIPHEEDLFGPFSVGSANFNIVKPCGRCIMVNVDQKTGISTKEPLKTLSAYRKKDNHVYFGANAVCTGSGILSTGDQLKFNTHAAKY